MIKVTIRKVKDAQMPEREYQRTNIDDTKQSVDFRLTDVSGTKNFIVWKDGTSEYVTDRKLEKLQSSYIWITDF